MNNQDCEKENKNRDEKRKRKYKAPAEFMWKWYDKDQNCWRTIAGKNGFGYF